MPLAALPNELLTHIFEYCNVGGPDLRFPYAPELGYPTLRSLSLVCKTLNGIAESVLYSRIAGRRNILPFLRTILHRPELSKHVRELNVKLVTSEAVSWSLIQLDKREVRQAVECFDNQNPQNEVWLKRINDNAGDATAALALILLPGLRTFELDAWWVSGEHRQTYNYFVTLVVRHVVSKQLEPGHSPYLRQLGSVSIQTPRLGAEKRDHFSIFRGLLSVTKVNICTAKLGADSAFNSAVSDVTIGTGSFEGNGRQLGNFLRSFSGLKRFSLESTENLCNDVLHYLATTQSNLTYLHLELSFVSLRDAICPPVQSLQPFHRLEILEISAFDTWMDIKPLNLENDWQLAARVARMVNILPRNIKQFTLIKASAMTLRYGLEVLKAKNERTSLLTHFRIVLDYIPSKNLRTDVIELSLQLIRLGRFYGVDVSVLFKDGLPVISEADLIKDRNLKKKDGCLPLEFEDDLLEDNNWGMGDSFFEFADDLLEGADFDAGDSDNETEVD